MWKDSWVCALYNHFRDRLWQGQNSWTSLNPRMSLVSSICSKDQAEHVTGIPASNKGAIKNLTASNLMLTLLVSFRGFWLLKASLEVSILALKWGGGKPRKCHWLWQHHHIQANVVQMNISASWLFLYYSWLAGKIVWQKFLWLL